LYGTVLLALAFNLGASVVDIPDATIETNPLHSITLVDFAAAANALRSAEFSEENWVANFIKSFWLVGLYGNWCHDLDLLGVAVESVWLFGGCFRWF
jgi:hypothetical protein